MTETISRFAGEHRFLSNFYLVRISLDGLVYKSVEHAFQASKTEDKEERMRIHNAFTARRAKQLGRKVTLRPDWERAKLVYMTKFIVQKFMDNPYLAKRLLDTGDATLIEGNTWGDTYWGMCNGKGENNLGKILMRIRDTMTESLEVIAKQEQPDG